MKNCHDNTGEESALFSLFVSIAERLENILNKMSASSDALTVSLNNLSTAVNSAAAALTSSPGSGATDAQVTAFAAAADSMTAQLSAALGVVPVTPVTPPGGIVNPALVTAQNPTGNPALVYPASSAVVNRALVTPQNPTGNPAWGNLQPNTIGQIPQLVRRA